MAFQFLSSETKKAITVAALIICAAVFRADVLWLGHTAPVLSLTRSMIYIGLFMYWGISVRKRIIQRQTARLLQAIAAMLVMWMALRTIRYSLVPEGFFYVQLWYAYYIPMLLIPVLMVFTALSLGWPEERTLKPAAGLLYIPALILIIMVQTNQLHELVFRFPEAGVVLYAFNNYAYGPGYYLCVLWEAVNYLAAFMITIGKSRQKHDWKNLWLPFLPILALALYTILHAMHLPLLQVLLGDMTVFVCLMIIAFLEACIRCGLIRSNSDYEELFTVGRLGARIVDKDGIPVYQSMNACSMSGEQRSRVIREGSCEFGRNMILESHPLRGGYVIWQKDVEALQSAAARLRENEEELSERLTLQKENYATRLAIEEYREENRLYDKLKEQNSQRVVQLKKLLEEYTKTDDTAVKRKILKRAAILMAYVKRRGNLILLGEKKQRVEAGELALCFSESLSNLELSDVECAMDFMKEGSLRYADAVRIYDFFERVAEAAPGTLKAVFLTLKKKGDMAEFFLEAECDADLERAGELADSFRRQDNLWNFRIGIQEVQA